MRTVYVVMIAPEYGTDRPHIFAGVWRKLRDAQESVHISYSRLPLAVTFVSDATGNHEIRYGNEIVGKIIFETLRNRPEHL